MRWDALFDDLEAQLARQEAGELDAEIAERVRAERGQVLLSERLLAQQGRPLRVGVPSAVVVGTVLDAAPSWVVLAAGIDQVLIPIDAVVTVEGLSRATALPPGAVLRRLGLGHALRALARDRATVRVNTAATVLTGTIDRVGADHLDLALHAAGEWRRSGAVTGVATVTFRGLHAVWTNQR